MILFSQGSRSRKLVAAAVRIVLLFSLSTGLSQGEESLEYKIKAAYLYNFTKFITWPSLTGETFNICLVGEDPFNDLLDNLANKTAHNKPIRIQRYSSFKQVHNCQIVYVDNPGTPVNTALPNALLVGNIAQSLTVSSQPFFAESHGMIGFVLEQEKVRLHINLKNLKKSGLEISAKLIEVSTLVGEDEHE